MSDTTSVFYQLGQAVSQKISSTSSGFDGGTISSNITIQKDNPVLLLRDTQSDGAPLNQASYVEYQKSDGSAKGYVGYGTNSDDDLDLKNHMGHIRISPASGHQVYIGNSAVITSDNISSYALTSGGVASQIQIGSGIQLKESGDRADLLQIVGLTSTWAGIQIKNNTTEHLFSLMSDGAIFGLYDDQQNEWAWQYTENAGHQFRYNNVVKLSTNSAGATVSGTLTATSLSGDGASVTNVNYNNLTNKPSIPSVSSSSQYILTASGSYGTVKVNDNRGVSWAGYAIRDDWVLMSNGADTCGIYNDTDNEWGLICRRNAETELYHNGAVKMETTSAGVSVAGAVGVTNGEITSVGKGRFGGWGTYSTYSGDATEIGVSSGDGWILPYNRSTSTYLPNMYLQCGSKIRLKRDTKGTDISGLTSFGPADQAYTTMQISPGPASSGATSYISTYNSNNMGFRTGGTNLGMEITNSGAYVRMPKNPFVLAQKTVHQTSSGVVACDSILNQVGNSYNTSTGHFTAPVTGRYVCSFTVLPYGFNTSNTSTIFWYVNGSSKAFGGTYTRMYGNYFGQGNTLTFYLYQGDYVYPYFNRSASCGLHSNYTFLSITYIG